MEYSDLNDSEVEIELWDDPTEVSSDFIITGNSTCDGMLTTHDYHFKIQYSFYRGDIFYYMCSNKKNGCQAKATIQKITTIKDGH